MVVLCHHRLEHHPHLTCRKVGCRLNVLTTLPFRNGIRTFWHWYHLIETVSTLDRNQRPSRTIGVGRPWDGFAAALLSVLMDRQNSYFASVRTVTQVARLGVIAGTSGGQCPGHVVRQRCS
jgi:hypothetical protein